MTIPVKLHLLEVVEYFIPIIFFLLAHFLDTRINKHWRQWGEFPDKWIVKIFHYQWELCLLVISLYYVYGFRYYAQSHEVSENGQIVQVDGIELQMGQILLLFCALSVVALFVIGFVISNRNRNKFNALPLYLAIIFYFALGCLNLLMEHVLDWDKLVPIACVLCMITLLIFERTEKVIVPPIPRTNAYWHNSYIYWNTPKSMNAIRAQAVYKICEEAIRKQKCRRALTWVDRYKKLMPREKKVFEGLENAITRCRQSK